jgi:putative PIN family toxin of toxin-antitoxin system
VKVVLDTNVLMSGIFFGGAPHLILKAWHDGRFDLVLSREIYSEYRQTAALLAESYPPVNLQSILELIEEDAQFCEAPALLGQVCTYPDDDKFLACALASGAQVIVS